MKSAAPGPGPYDGAMAESVEDELEPPSNELAEPADDDEPQDPGQPLDWWHRDHPTFLALTGFFSGLLAVAVIPALFIGLLKLLFSDRVAEEAFPFVLLFFVVPIGLITFPHTRRFGKYLLLGMVVTMLVVFGVGSFVAWLMLRSTT